MSDDNASKPVINEWIRLVESSGFEMGVTLILHGVIVTGTLTPLTQYAAWFTEVLNRTTASARGQSSAGGIMPAMTIEQSEEVRRSWKQRMRGEDMDDVVFARCALKNVTLHQGHALLAVRFPYLLVNAAAVSAASLGIPGDASSGDPR